MNFIEGSNKDFKVTFITTFTVFKEIMILNDHDNTADEDDDDGGEDRVLMTVNRN